MSSRLALWGGDPVRTDLLPYGKQQIDDEEVDAVVQVLRSDWLTTGPMVEQFERAFADFTGSKHAIAVSSGTAALHAAVHAVGITPGDEVIVPAMTFAATANCVVFEGATPVFADVQPDTLLIDPSSVEEKITRRTRAVIAVDYAGQPCDYEELNRLTIENDLTLISDACHSLGASYEERFVGNLAELNIFSLHPVKHITTGEGGLVTTNDDRLAVRIKRFRNHGIVQDHHQRTETGSWFYEIIDLGYNYRLTDFQSALGLAQLSKLTKGIDCRRRIAREYDKALEEIDFVRALERRENRSHAYHLYVVQFDLEHLSGDRGDLFAALRAEGIGVNVHYIPVHLHPYYRVHFGTGPGLCPVAEDAYERIVSLPLFPAMVESDIDDVIEALGKVIGAYRAPNVS